jgi:acetyl esterase/lipase/opacity protein-like surface antigen
MKALLAAMLAIAIAVAVAVAVVAVAAPAAANVPDPLTRVNPVRIPWTGDGTNGTLTTEVTYSDTTATATASTGDTISLGKGLRFHLRTCVAYHLATTLPVSSCDERIVDTRQSTGSVSTHAPAVTLSGRPRPTTGSWGYFTPYAEVQYESGDSTQVIAQSWPDEGLQGAGVAVAAQGQTTGTLPANSTLTLDGPYTSAINTGQPDSICAAGTTPGIYGSVRPGVRTSHPAFADAPAYYEVGPPTGDYTGRTPRGVMLLIHGGGWWVGGVEGVGSMRDDAERWRARGWETVSFSYRACGQSLGDALWFYDKARGWFGASAKICSMGTSAGGQLSLLIGANRRGLACIVSVAGPTDLSRIQDEPVYDPASARYDSVFGSRLVHNLGAAAFGEENLATYSPATQISATLQDTRVLQAFSADDTLVPFQQAADLGEAMSAANPAAYVDNVQLAIGTIHFGHGDVTQAALDDFYAREERLVAPLTSSDAG